MMFFKWWHSKGFYIIYKFTFECQFKDTKQSFKDTTSYNKMTPRLQCILDNFWNNNDEQYKTNMLIIFLKIHYGIITTTPYNYIILFTDENLRNFILDF